MLVSYLIISGTNADECGFCCDSERSRGGFLAVLSGAKERSLPLRASGLQGPRRDPSLRSGRPKAAVSAKRSDTGCATATACLNREAARRIPFGRLRASAHPRRSFAALRMTEENRET